MDKVIINHQQPRLHYMITVSKNHFLSAIMLLKTLRSMSQDPITVVGNLNSIDQKKLNHFNIRYIDENDIDLTGRFPVISWNKKYKDIGWYKQQFIRLSIDRFIQDEHVVILDSEVFIFNNWDTNRFFDADGTPRCFYWISSVRKSDWDYQMYRGAAYLLSFLPECKDIMDYANSDQYKRHISGVVFFNTKNIEFIWKKLAAETDLQKNLDVLFNHRADLAFSDHDFYGLGVDYALFDQKIKTKLHNNLLGWYDTHDDTHFHLFKNSAMWSMCQHYHLYNTEELYYRFMLDAAKQCHKHLPLISLSTKKNKIKKLIKPVYIRARMALSNMQSFWGNIFLLEKLDSYVKKVEYYQPLYNVGHYSHLTPQRICTDRADVILEQIKPFGGCRILDLGCSLGFFSYYFSDRGYSVDGVESNPDNIAICRLLENFNKKKPTFIHAEFSQKFLENILPNQYNIAFIFSLLHHIIHVKGLEYVQDLMVQLLEKIPIIFVELAVNTEETTAPWVKSLPDDELAIFDKCKNISINKIGMFSNHLSPVHRSLYMINRNKISILDKNYHIYKQKFLAYRGADYHNRNYYDCGDIFIKRYLLTANCHHQNLGQLSQEIQNNRLLPKNNHFPQMLSYVKKDDYIDIIFNKIPGKNIYDILFKGGSIPTWEVFHDVLKALQFLLQQGLYHNDLRLWNILFDGKNSYLFDLGLTSQCETENTNIALLWLIAELHQFNCRKLPYPLMAKPHIQLNKIPTIFHPVVKALQEKIHFEHFLDWFHQSQLYIDDKLVT